MIIHNYHDEEEMSREVASKVFIALKSGLIKNLALPTGRTPILFYNYLADLINENQFKLDEIYTYNLDEFIFSNEKQKEVLSYKNYMDEHFFSKVKFPLKNIHFPSKEQDYDQLISSRGGIDLALIGIGNNGHIAFNEPGSEVDSPTRLVNLKIESREQNAILFNQSVQNIPDQAITMGLKTLLSSKIIFLLATGPSKKEILKKSFTENICRNIPASYLQSHPALEIFIDKAANWITK